MDSIRQPVNLLGHSYGALCSLEAALLTRNIRKLMLYEPAMHITGEKIHPPGTIERLEALLAEGTGTGSWLPRCARSPDCRPNRWKC